MDIDVGLGGPASQRWIPSIDYRSAVFSDATPHPKVCDGDWCA